MELLVHFVRSFQFYSTWVSKFNVNKKDSFHFLFLADFTLASRSTLAERKKRDKDGTETCKSWFNRNKKLDETSKVKKGNDWY